LDSSQRGRYNLHHSNSGIKRLEKTESVVVVVVVPRVVVVAVSDCAVVVVVVPTPATQTSIRLIATPFMQK